jgi:hexulose-6-phosphate isomerase
MNRREFLAGTAAMAALGARGARAKFRKAVNLNMVQGGADLAEKFRIAKEAGFAGLEIDAPNGLDRAALLAARDASGLTIHGVVCSVHWKHPLSDPQPQVRERGLAGLGRAIEDCKAYGGQTVLLVPAVVNKTVSYAEAWERSQAEIRKVLPQAEAAGVTVAIENVWNQFLLSPLEMARYVDEFKSPAAAAYFDVGNVINYGWPEHWIHTLGKRIRRIHVKEFSRKKRDAEGLWKGFQVELLEGDNDWPSVRKALEDNEFDGWCTAEVPGGQLDRLKAISDRMDRIFA